MINLDNTTFLEMYNKCTSQSDLIRLLGLPVNGRSSKLVKLKIKEFGLSNINRQYSIKHKLITKLCPVCNKSFSTKETGSQATVTCSYVCSNTYFRSGANNGSYKHGSNNYRNIAKLGLKEECARCGYKKYPILEVHHKDRNRTNNSIENLEFLCPTCHGEEHFLTKTGIWGSK